uniref:(northern house mosquito) hypothetical protein n=1 Tax=Culex pipiens TaxID=7175 RepID=A0A8D8EWX9_CULPI
MSIKKIVQVDYAVCCVVRVTPFVLNHLQNRGIKTFSFSDRNFYKPIKPNFTQIDDKVIIRAAKTYHFTSTNTLSKGNQNDFQQFVTNYFHFGQINFPRQLSNNLIPTPPITTENVDQIPKVIGRFKPNPTDDIQLAMEYAFLNGCVAILLQKLNCLDNEAT